MDIEYNDFTCSIDENKIYSLPSDIIIIHRYGFWLYISPKNGSWIVLETQTQRDVFRHIFSRSTVGDIFKQFDGYEEDVKYVLAQIEGKHLEHTFKSFDDDSFELRIYLTNNCNLRCKHCFMYADNSFENELSKEEIITLIKKSAEAGATKLILTGGEVGLSKSFVPALIIAKEYNMYTQVLSNGTSWTKALFEEAKPYIDEIQISVDGFNENVNAEIRGKGAFDKALKTVEQFLNADIFTSVIVTPLYGYAETYFNEYVEFGNALANKYEDKDFLIIFGNEIIDGREVKFSKERNATYAKTIEKLCEEIYPNNELTLFVKNHQYNTIFRNCGYGSLTVNSQGDVSFCGRVYEVKKYGNIREDEFSEILRLRKTARKLSSVETFTPCNQCDLRYVCGGGCRITNYNEITKIDDLYSVDTEKLAPRNCSAEYKENLYRLMIESNDFLLW